MPRFFILTSILVLLALLGPFFLSWPFALTLGAFAALFFPPVVILTGIFIDVLYFDGSAGLVGAHQIPYFTIVTILIAIVAFFVHEFVKTSIIS